MRRDAASARNMRSWAALLICAGCYGSHGSAERGGQAGMAASHPAGGIDTATTDRRPTVEADATTIARDCLPDLVAGLGTPSADAVGTTVGIASGQRLTCALSELGDVSCRGTFGLFQRDGEDLSPPRDLPIIAVSAGVYYTCVVDERGIISCWGSDDGGQTEVPSGA